MTDALLADLRALVERLDSLCDRWDGESRDAYAEGKRDAYDLTEALLSALIAKHETGPDASERERLDPIDEQAIRRNKRHQELVAEAVRGERKRIARVLSGMADESFYYFDSEAGDALRAAARIVRGEGS